MQNGLKISGHVIISKCTSKKRWVVYEEKNLVVNTGRNSLVKAMVQEHTAYADSALVYPRYCAFGRDTSVPYPLDPAAGDTNLESLLNDEPAESIKEFTDISFAGDYTVKLTTLYDDAELVTDNLREAGIFAGAVSGGGVGVPYTLDTWVLIARTTGGGTMNISKGNTTSLNVDWILTLNAA